MIIFADAQPVGQAISFGLPPDTLTHHALRALKVKPETVITVHPDEGELFDLDDPSIDAIVLGGSVVMADEGRPWQPGFEEWIRAIVNRGIPLLGICFGHQTIAKALGGHVANDPHGREFGVTTLHKTATGKKHFMLEGLDDSFILSVCHLQSVLEAPKGAVLLAEQPIHPWHLVMYNDTTVGTQAEIAYDYQWVRGIANFRKQRFLDEKFIKDEDELKLLLHFIDANLATTAHNGQIIAQNFLKYIVKPYMKQQGRNLDDLLLSFKPSHAYTH